MKKSAINATLLLTTIFSMVACQQAAEPVDKEKIKAEIQARENEFAELYNKGELKNIGYYADDAIAFAQNKAPLIGKPAIIEYLKEGAESSSKGNKISFTTNEVFVFGDASQVLEIGYFRLVDSVDVPINSGNYMVLFEKREGKYAVIREMSASTDALEE